MSLNSQPPDADTPGAARSPNGSWHRPQIVELPVDEAAEVRRRFDNLDTALALAAPGLPIFPAAIEQRADGTWSKRPLVTGWQQRATTDSDQIQRWWRQWPDAVPGAELGRVGLMVIDADRHGGPDGVLALERLAAAHGGLPDGPVTETPSGGRHYIYRQREGEALGNRRGALPLGIDVRGAGGWIVAPGAIRPDGKRWAPAPDMPLLADAYMASTIPAIPDWLVEIIHATPERPPPGDNGARRPTLSSDREPLYARQALRGIADELKATPPGGRNEALNKAAFRMAGFVARGWIDQTDVVDELSEAAIASGLDVNEVQRTLASGLTAGLQQPAADLEERVQHYRVSPNGSESASPSASAPSETKQRGGDRRTQAQILIEFTLRDGVELYHSPDGTAYADIIVKGHRETWPLRSAGFRGWLRRAYYLETGGAPNGEAMATAMGVIEARASYDGTQRPVHLRVAEHGNRIYLDLCDECWRAVEISADGWQIVDRPPVRFRRTRGMLAIPEPVRGGRLDELRQHFHMSANDYVLAVSWLLAILRGRGPYPILALTGEQGTGKSFTGDMLRRLLDPNTAPLRSLPRDTRDLYVAAINGHILVFDNLSGVPAEISDALCRLSTGGGFSTRALYTDGDEILFDGQRPIALTSITDVASRSDLADRLVIVRLQVIPDEERRPEGDLRAAFEAARPRILGALLDAVSHGLMQLPHTRLNRLPRMADYALWVRACETAIWQAGMHMAAYEENRADAVEVVLETDPVAAALRQHMECRTEYTATATELFNSLNPLVSDHVRRSRQWPTNPRVLSGQLTRLSPALRRSGISIEHRRQGRAGVRLLHITREPDA